jgi:vacuolar-type H+-ATPase subunit E/Vma4
MALEDIFSALEEQADKEIEQILQDARDQAEAIAEEADDEAQTLRERMVNDRERTTRSSAVRTTNAARLDSKKRVAAIKQQAVEDVFKAALGRLAAARAGSDYDGVFVALAEEAIAGLDGELEVLVDPADLALAEKTFAELDVPVSIRADIETAGGLIVMTNEGRVMRRNTLEERMGKLRQMTQSDVAEILFV